MTSAEIGERIKYARSLRGSTLDDIAKKVGVAKSTIQRYENGKIETIKLPVVEAIAIALNVNPAWVVGKSSSMEIEQKKAPKILHYYNLLNNLGKQEAEKRIEELTHIQKYIISEQQKVEFSEENYIIIQPHFSEIDDAKAYLQDHKAAAFSGNGLTDEEIIQMANIIKSNNDK